MTQEILAGLNRNVDVITKLNFPEFVITNLNSLLTHGFKVNKLKVKRDCAFINVQTGDHKYKIELYDNDEKMSVDVYGPNVEGDFNLTDAIEVDNHLESALKAARGVAERSEAIGVNNAFKKAELPPENEIEGDPSQQPGHGPEPEEAPAATLDVPAAQPSPHLFAKVLAASQPVEKNPDAPTQAEVSGAVEAHLKFWKDLKALLRTNNEEYVALWLEKVDLNDYIKAVSAYVTTGSTGLIDNPILMKMFEVICHHFGGRASMDDVVKFAIMIHARTAHLGL